MTSGEKTCRPELRALGVAALLAALSTPGLAFDLPELMALLAHRSSGQARFTEQRTVKGLDEPLVSSGTLSFSAPDRFARRTLKPRPEAMVVEGNGVTLTRGTRSRTLQLDSSPEAVVAVESVRATLTGNAAVLRKYFDAKVDGSAERWTLDLQPREAGALRRIRIAGQRDEVRQVETELLDGDRTLMTIEPVAATASP